MDITMRKDIQVLFDEETEKSLIGAFLINPENLIMSTLRSEDFSNKNLGELYKVCLLYTSDAADDLLCVDLGGRRIIKKTNTPQTTAYRQRRNTHTNYQHPTP